MHRPKLAANTHMSGYVLANMLRMHTTPEHSTAMLCTRSVLTHLKSESHPTATRPTVFVIPATQRRHDVLSCVSHDVSPFSGAFFCPVRDGG